MVESHFNIGYILPIITLWQRIYSEILKYKPDPVVTNNIVSSIHCITYITHYNYAYNIDYVLHISIGYYIYDLLYILSWYLHKHKLQSSEYYLNMLYSIHHLIAIALINETLTSENKLFMLYGYYLMELSNIMLYVSLHIEKEYAGYLYLTIISDIIHLVWYSYIRLFLLTSFVYDSVYTLNFTVFTKSMIFVIYIIGIGGSCLLLKRNIKNITIMNSVKKPVQ